MQMGAWTLRFVVAPLPVWSEDGNPGRTPWPGHGVEAGGPCFLQMFLSGGNYC